MTAFDRLVGIAEDRAYGMQDSAPRLVAALVLALRDDIVDALRPIGPVADARLRLLDLIAEAEAASAGEEEQPDG